MSEQRLFVVGVADNGVVTCQFDTLVGTHAVVAQVLAAVSTSRGHEVTVSTAHADGTRVGDRGWLGRVARTRCRTPGGFTDGFPRTEVTKGIKI